MIDLSIIIPAFNEAAKISEDIAAADRFLREHGLSGQIIVVDDGSTDGTFETAQEAAARTAVPCIVERIIHGGKGAAVRTGILKSTGSLVMFADSGGCVPLTDALHGMELIRTNQCQIAHGSRRISQEMIHRSQSLFRQLCSAAFSLLLISDIKRLSGLTDTQCGFKLYRGDVARMLYSKSTIDDFMFDIEIILLAMEQNCAIAEFAVHWTCDPDSRVRLARHAGRVLLDLWKLRRRFKHVLVRKEH